MDCPTEEALIRKRLGKVEGIERLDFDLMNRRLEVQYRLPNPLRHACHGRTRGRGLICPMKRPPPSAPRENESHRKRVGTTTVEIPVIAIPKADR